MNPDKLAFVLLKDYKFIRTNFSGHFTDLPIVAFCKEKYIDQLKYTFLESTFLKGLKILTEKFLTIDHNITED